VWQHQRVWKTGGVTRIRSAIRRIGGAMALDRKDGDIVADLRTAGKRPRTLPSSLRTRRSGDSGRRRISRTAAVRSQRGPVRGALP